MIEGTLLYRYDGTSCWMLLPWWNMIQFSNKGMHTHSAISGYLSLQPNATATVRLECILSHGNTAHTATHGTRSGSSDAHSTHSTHSTHLRSALASRLKASLVPLETCHPEQATRIVDGLIHQHESHHPMLHQYSKCRVPTSSIASTSAPAAINWTAASDISQRTAA